MHEDPSNSGEPVNAHVNSHLSLLKYHAELRLRLASVSEGDGGDER